MYKKILRLSFVLLLIVFVSACTLPWKKNKSAKTEKTQNNIENPQTLAKGKTKIWTGAMKQFMNYSDLKEFFQTSNLYLGQSTRAGTANNLKQTNSFSYFANYQQAWAVDRADIIKTDNSYIYALVRDKLFVIKTDPTQDMKVVSKITFNSRPDDLFVDGKRLIVFGVDSKTATPFTFLKIFDISNPNQPKQVQDFDFAGKYVDTRLVGDYVYFLVANKISSVADALSLPKILMAGTMITPSFPVSYFDIPYQSYEYTSLIAVNIRDNKENIQGHIYIMDDGQDTYLTADNLYITYTRSLNKQSLEMAVRKKLLYPQLTPSDQEKIAKIDSSPSYILNQSDKNRKVNQIILTYLTTLTAAKQKSWQQSITTTLHDDLLKEASKTEKTIIYKNSIKNDRIEYKTKGEVSGKILNQFSLNEAGKYLRLATTRTKAGAQLSKSATDSYTNIYVLDADLKIVGKLENLATSNSISSAHFIGNRAYLISSELNDPVYIINLAKPATPSILGAVKIPQAVTYLFPVDANGTKLMGLGYYDKIAKDSGNKVKELKLSLFDFSNLAKPKEISSYLLGGTGSSSISLSDHQSLLYSASKNLISVPTSLTGDNNQLVFRGVTVFSLENNQLKLKGKIDHSDGGHFMSTDNWQGIHYYDNTVRRSIYIGDNLYTFSNKFLKANKISDLSLIQAIKLTPDSANDFTTTPLLDSGLATTTTSTPTTTPETKTTTTPETKATSTATTTVDNKPLADQPATATSTATTTATTTNIK